MYVAPWSHPQQYFRPHLIGSHRSVAGYARANTVFQCACVTLQLLHDRTPTRKRFLLDFVGQDYVASPFLLVFVDVLIWFFHMIVIAMTVEEVHCRRHPSRLNRLDVTEADRYPLTSMPADATHHDTDREPLLDEQESNDAAGKPTTSTSESFVPSTEEPIAFIRWSMLWRTGAAPHTGITAHTPPASAPS
ncbi:hypothetical protein ACI68E_004161 [Malassezia pachydermatis]